MRAGNEEKEECEPIPGAYFIVCRSSHKVACLSLVQWCCWEAEVCSWQIHIVEQYTHTIQYNTIQSLFQFQHLPLLLSLFPSYECLSPYNFLSFVGYLTMISLAGPHRAEWQDDGLERFGRNLRRLRPGNVTAVSLRTLRKITPSISQDSTDLLTHFVKRRCTGWTAR
jgi:hypothetical protein